MLPARFAASFAAASLLSGCAALAGLILPEIERQGAQFEEMADFEAAAKKAPGDLGLLASLAGMAPEHSGLNAVVAKNYGGYAFGFVEPVAGPFDRPDKALVATAKSWYVRGRDAGLRALRASAAFRDAEEKPLEEYTAALAAFGKPDVPAMFWTAYNWGQLIMLSKDEPERVAELPRVLALVEQVQRVEPSYYHGSAHAFEMVNAASRPPTLGGDPAVAGAAYERAVAVDGRVAPGGPARFMTHDVMFAQFGAVQIQDHDLFRQKLQAVLEAPADILPAARLANVIAKRRAHVLLSKIADFFPDLDEEEEEEEQ